MEGIPVEIVDTILSEAMRDDAVAQVVVPLVCRLWRAREIEFIAKMKEEQKLI